MSGSIYADDHLTNLKSAKTIRAIYTFLVDPTRLKNEELEVQTTDAPW